MLKKLTCFAFVALMISCNHQSESGKVLADSTATDARAGAAVEDVPSAEQAEKSSDHSQEGYDHIKNQLQGEWISTEDSNYVMIFKGDWVYDTYIGEGESDSKSKFVLSNKCPEEPDLLTSNQTILFKEKDGLCYSLDYVNDNTLQLIYLPRGNTLSFFKRK